MNEATPCSLHDLNDDGVIDAMDLAIVMEHMGDRLFGELVLGADGTVLSVRSSDGEVLPRYFPVAGGPPVCCCGCGGDECDCCFHDPSSIDPDCCVNNPCASGCPAENCTDPCEDDPCGQDCDSRFCNPDCGEGFGPCHRRCPGGGPCSHACEDAPCDPRCGGDPCAQDCPNAPCDPTCGGDPCALDCPTAPCDPLCGGGPCDPACPTWPCDPLCGGDPCDPLCGSAPCDPRCGDGPCDPGCPGSECNPQCNPGAECDPQCNPGANCDPACNPPIDPKCNPQCPSSFDRCHPDCHPNPECDPQCPQYGLSLCDGGGGGGPCPDNCNPDCNPPIDPWCNPDCGGDPNNPGCGGGGNCEPSACTPQPMCAYSSMQLCFPWDCSWQGWCIEDCGGPGCQPGEWTWSVEGSAVLSSDTVQFGAPGGTSSLLLTNGCRTYKREYVTYHARLESVEFLGGHDVARDSDGLPYAKPHWQYGELHDQEICDLFPQDCCDADWYWNSFCRHFAAVLGARRHPVAYTKGSPVQVQVKYRIQGLNVNSVTAWVSSPLGEQDEVTLTNAGGDLYAATFDLASNLPEEIRYYASFPINVPVTIEGSIGSGQQVTVGSCGLSSSSNIRCT